MINSSELKKFHVSDDLFKVNIDEIVYPNVERHGFHNPRTLLLGKEISPDEIPGFSLEQMESLKCSIRDNGLIHHITAWHFNNEELVLACGERRRRAIELLLEENCKCKCPDGKWVDAEDLYSEIVIKVYNGDLLGLKALAFQENEESVGIGDSATLTFVNDLDENNFSESEIAKIVNKSITWVRDSLSLRNLDEESYNEFMKGNINRSAAKILLEITNVDERLEKLRYATKIVQERAKNAIFDAQYKIQECDLELDITQVHYDLDEIDKDELEKKRDKLLKKRQALKDSTRKKSQIKVADVRAAGGSQNSVSKSLTASKMRSKWKKPIQEILETKDIPEGVDLDDVQRMLVVCRNFDMGNSDVIEVLKEMNSCLET